MNCRTCQAQGRVRKYKILYVLFDYQDHSQIIGAIEIPNNKLSNVTGEKVLNKMDSRITTLDELSDKRLAKHALEFLSQYNTSNSIILYQNFEIDETPVFKVSYKKHSNSKTKFLWIYGNEHEVYFDGEWSITANTKKMLFVAIAIIALSVIGIGGAYFFNKQPNPPLPTKESLVSANAFCTLVDLWMEGDQLVVVQPIMDHI
jgi:spore coat protein CotF